MRHTAAVPSIDLKMDKPDKKSPDALTPLQRLAISEQRHRLLAENARDVVWSMSPMGEITYVSSAIEKLRGLTPEEAMAQRIDEILTPDSQAEVADYFARLHKAAASGGELPSYRGDLQYFRKDCSTFWTEVFAFPLADDQGQLIEIVGVTRDIDARKQHQDGLEQARLAAEAANQAKTKFLAHISHEIRTPLTALLSWIDHAASQAFSDDQRELLHKSQDAGQLLLGIINDLLDLSRLEQSTLKLRHEAFDLKDVLSQVQDLTKPVINGKAITYKSSIQAGVPDQLMGDPTRLTQALLNLTSNAGKFTESGQIEVAVELATATPLAKSKQVHLRFTVKDTGPGIDPEWHSHLFSDLIQVSMPKHRPAAGHGLGLAITKRLANLMGGSVDLQSQLGEGSTFWFTAFVDLNKTTPHHFEDSQHTPSHTLKGKRVLLVEDYASLRLAMVRTLVALGIHVDEASNGQEALRLVNQNPYDLVLMDLSMPVMDGRTCTVHIRQHRELAQLPIIALTAAGFEDQRDELIALGISDCLLKPFALNALIQTMTRHLR